MISQQLRELTKAFLEISTTPALDAELILAAVLGRDRNYVLTHPEISLSLIELQRLEDLKQKRRRGYPLAYLTNRREFWGHDFYVDESVLIPRPETELLITEAIKNLSPKKPQYVIDIGTGSGCIAITLAREIPQHTYLATDISAPALRTAQLNAIKHQVKDRITFYQGNLLEPLYSPAAPLPAENLFLIANLPYVDMENINTDPSSESSKLQSGLRFEPTTALDGGPRGKVLLENFLRQVSRYNLHRTNILMEIGLNQAPGVTEFVKAIMPASQIETVPDKAGIDRMIKIEI
jgi:release factor glutamine methyltransferase